MLNRTNTVKRALLLLVAVFMVPTLLASVGAILYVYNEEQARFQQGLTEATRSLSLAVEREIARREAVVQTLAGSPSLTFGDLRGFHDYARQIAPTVDSVIVLHAPDGRQLLNTRLPFGATTPPTSLQVQREAIGPTATLVSDLYMAPVGKEYSFAVQVPVVRDGQLRYYLSLGGYARKLQAILQDQELPEGWVASVLDRNRTVVARSHDASRYVGQPANPQLQQHMQGGDDAGLFESRLIDGSPVLAAYKRSDVSGWAVAVGVPMRSITTPMQAALMLGALALLLLGGALLAALQVGRRLAAPVTRLQAASEALGRGDRLPHEPTGLRETDQVLDALRQAQARIQQARGEQEARVASALADAEKAHRAVVQSQRLEALGQLTGGVAHDFNNLLMVVRTNLHLLRSRLPDSMDPTPLERIQRATDTGAQLTRQLLAFARRQPLRPEIIDLPSRLPDLTSLIRPALGSHVEMACEVAPDTRSILGDPAEFELALINMSMNARDAMPEGGRLTIRARNASASEAAQPSVLIEVADTGQGIAPEVLERVFEPFYTTKPVGHGTGLGLSQVHGFVTAAGGTVRVHSEVGRGTCLTLLLPAAQRPPAADDQPPQAPAVATGAGRRILLVEDNDEVATATADLLREAHYEVDHLPDGDAARARLAQSAGYDCVLSDIRMPGQTDGLALAQWIGEHHPRLPVVLTTGYSQELRQAFKLGLEVLPKPSSPETLLDALGRATAQREQTH